MTTATSDPTGSATTASATTAWRRPSSSSAKRGHPLGHGAAALATALEALRRRHAGRPLRVWCAGAGGLAEPFTVALLAASAGVDVEIIATDSEAHALGDARAFTIPGRLVHLPGSVTSGRLAGDAAGHRPLPAVAARVRAAHGDLREIPGGGPFDLVVCRDVLHHLRPEGARQTWSRLLAATAPEGLLVLTAVDVLAAGQPLSGADDVILGADGRSPPVDGEHVVDVEHLVDDADAASTLRLAALLDEGAPLPRRAARLLRLAREAPALEEARVAAAALALADGQRELARQLLEAPLSLAWEGDASTILAVSALQEGALHTARALLGRAQPTSWLGAFLMGALLRRLQRDGDAAAHFRLALALLEGHGTAPAGATFLPGCSAEDARRVADAALRSRAAHWHGP